MSASTDIFNRDTLLAAALHGGAATIACWYLFPGQVGFNQRALMVGLVLAVVTVGADMAFPRVSKYVNNFNL